MNSSQLLFRVLWRLGLLRWRTYKPWYYTLGQQKAYVEIVAIWQGRASGLTGNTWWYTWRSRNRPEVLHESHEDNFGNCPPPWRLTNS